MENSLILNEVLDKKHMKVKNSIFNNWNSFRRNGFRKNLPLARFKQLNEPKKDMANIKPMKVTKRRIAKCFSSKNLNSDTNKLKISSKFVQRPQSIKRLEKKSSYQICIEKLVKKNIQGLQRFILSHKEVCKSIKKLPYQIHDEDLNFNKAKYMFSNSSYCDEMKRKFEETNKQMNDIKNKQIQKFHEVIFLFYN